MHNKLVIFCILTASKLQLFETNATKTHVNECTEHIIINGSKRNKIILFSVEKKCASNYNIASQHKMGEVNTIATDSTFAN